MKKIALAGAALMMAAFVVPALALPSVDMTLEVLSAQIAQGCSGGNQTWEIGTEINVQNTNEETVTFESTGFAANFHNGASGTQGVSVVNPDGFAPGTQIESGGAKVFHPVVQVSLPCDTQSATLFAELKIVGRDKTFTSSDDFIEGGTPVPVGPTGILGIAMLLGGAGALAQRLGRRPRPIASDRRSS